VTIVASSCGDPAALRERAEIHALRGEVDLAYRYLDAIRELRGFVPNAIHDAEDLRVVALVRAAEGDLAAAERALREVIQGAEVHRQLELHAQATRDLATVLRRAGQHVEGTVPIDPPAGSKRPCCTEMHIVFPNASLATSPV
jgi:hypothetical protein